jgi:hypothetical protein
MGKRSRGLRLLREHPLSLYQACTVCFVSFKCLLPVLFAVLTRKSFLATNALQTQSIYPSFLSIAKTWFFRALAIMYSPERGSEMSKSDSVLPYFIVSTSSPLHNLPPLGKDGTSIPERYQRIRTSVGRVTSQLFQGARANDIDIIALGIVSTENRPLKRVQSSFLSASRGRYKLAAKAHRCRKLR